MDYQISVVTICILISQKIFETSTKMATSSLFNAPPLSASSSTAAQATPNFPSLVPAVAPLTQEDVKKALPQNLRNSVTQAMVDTLNNIAADPIMAENIRTNFIGFSAILREGRFKTEEYINAVAYVSYKLMGFNNEESYSRTFPARYQTLISRGTSKKDIAAYVSAFHRGKLVNLIMEQSLVPSWVLNQDLHQKAITQLASLMTTAKSEKVQADAAIGLLNALKKPENREFQINLDVNESSGMKEMRSMLSQLAQQQRELIEQGSMKTIDVAASKLINKNEAEDV